MNNPILASTRYPRNLAAVINSAIKPVLARLGSNGSRVFFSWLLLVGVIAYYFSGISLVPFHPDESSWIFMSSDFEALFSNPLSLVWNSAQETDLNQNYRELNAPVAKYLIGAGRAITGLAPLKHDWDWSKSWQDNSANGALPSPALLWISRFSVALLFPFSLWLVYDTARHLDHWVTGLLAAGLFATSAIILLHTRRSMAEGALVFGVCLSIWSLVKYPHKPWAVAVAIAVAFNAKQTTLALLPVGFVAVVWAAWVKRRLIGDALKTAALFCLVFIGITFLLNPLLWNHPFQAGLAAIRARETLLSVQVSTAGAILPAQVLSSPVDHAAALVANVFILPPAIEDVGNYIQQTAASKTVYFQLPGTDLFRGLAGGAIMLALALAGLLFAVRLVARWKIHSQWPMAFFLLAFLAQAALLIVSIPLPYQRYWLPMTPFFCVLCALPIAKISLGLAGALSKRRPSA